MMNDDTKVEQQGIVNIRALTEAVQQEIEALAAICRQIDGLDLPLYLDNPRPASQETNQFFCYQGNTLVGVMSLSAGNHIEIMGMVHPKYRRRGIGRALLDAAVAECQQRGVRECLLVCEGNAQAGEYFIEAVGGTYCFSEYAMELNRTAFAQIQRPDPTIMLSCATADDFDTLVSLRMASGDEITQAVAHQTIQAWLQQDNQRFFIGHLKDQPIGMLRLQDDEPVVSINSFMVFPEHRQLGYGRQILMKTLDRLVTEDWETIMIEVETKNRNALGLYHSCGFQETTTYQYYHLSV